MSAALAEEMKGNESEELSIGGIERELNESEEARLKDSLD